MNSESRCFIWFCFAVVLFASVAIGGCCIYEKQKDAFRLNMAEQGYQEHVELLPGSPSAVRYWRPVTE